MIHADFDISGLQKSLPANFIKPALIMLIRQITFIISSLTTAFNPGHMGITVKSNSLRLESQCFVNSISYAALCLKRQAKNQVMRHRGKTGFTCELSYLLNPFKRLNTVNRLLHCGTIILDSKTNPIKTQFKQAL